MRNQMVIAALWVLLLAGGLCNGQQNTSEAGRKVVSRVVPGYPELARRMNIRGIVKIEATVAPNGTVKSTRAIGGNPLLISAAENALLKWRFAPNAEETHEIIELRFNPD
ncbi:MAG: hypothetical protein DMG68_15950 [Acidobacteria bacterium]|nr:MAG: hypothetical protein DMG68_15950 [Acidobacteriota bacterium]